MIATTRTITIVRQVGKATITIPPDLASCEKHGSGRATKYEQGAHAAAAGEPIEACPHKAGQGSGSWRAAWERGWRDWHNRESN